MDSLKTRAAESALAWDGPNPCPPLTAAEDASLRKSLLEDGFIPAFPVVLSAGPACEGQVIDGFNRMRLCEELEIEPIVLLHPCATELDFKILQIKANLERRQLNTAQRSLLGVRLLPLIEARSTLRQAASRFGQSAQSDLSGGTTSCTTEESGKSLDLAAEAAGVSRESIRQMKKITEAPNADQLLDKIHSGTSIKSAYQTLRDVDTSIESETTAAAELAEHFAGNDEARHDALDRVTGDVVRLLMEAEALIRKHGVTAAEVRGLRSRPHTFRGVAIRLNEWLGEIEDAL